MADLEKFRTETRTWLEQNCPPEMRKPQASEGDTFWGGRNAKFSSDAQRVWFEREQDVQLVDGRGAADAVVCRDGQQHGWSVGSGVVHGVA